LVGVENLCTSPSPLLYLVLSRAEPEAEKLKILGANFA
jgi:hypothetical protein